MRISRIAVVVLVTAMLAGCSALVPAPTPTVDDDTTVAHEFTLVDHYVGVDELAESAVAMACRTPGPAWTREEADERWRMAELYDASDFPSKLTSVRFSIEEAQRYEKFLIDVVRPPESIDAAEFACEGERERWKGEVDRQHDACASGNGTCWSRDLAGDEPAAPTAPLDPSIYIVQVDGPVDENYVDVEELAAAVIAAECSPREATWTQHEADAYRSLAELFGESEFPSALSEQANYVSLADTYDEFLVGQKRIPESFPAAQTSCDYVTERWEAEVERQIAACAPGSASTSSCWSRDLQAQ